MFEGRGSMRSLGLQVSAGMMDVAAAAGPIPSTELREGVLRSAWAAPVPGAPDEWRLYPSNWRRERSGAASVIESEWRDAFGMLPLRAALAAAANGSVPPDRAAWLRAARTGETVFTDLPPPIEPLALVLLEPMWQPVWAELQALDRQ